MKALIATLFSFGLIAFVGIWYLLVGGSGKMLGTGIGLFTIVLLGMSIVFVYKVLKQANVKFTIIFLLYFSAIVITLYGLVIRVVEGIGRFQHPVGLRVFFIGLGALILLLIGQFIYTMLFFKEPQPPNSIK